MNIQMNIQSEIERAVSNLLHYDSGITNDKLTSILNEINSQVPDSYYARKKYHVKPKRGMGLVRPIITYKHLGTVRKSAHYKDGVIMVDYYFQPVPAITKLELKMVLNNED